MLGSMVVDDLSRNVNFIISATVRNTTLADKCKAKIDSVNWLVFDANAPEIEKAVKVIDGHDWVINAIGITKPLIHDDNALEIERAIRINSLLPHQIARKAASAGAQVIQIATDCVYSGKKGNYTESDESDALDAYGKSKSLGEVFGSGFFNLRTSIIGPEPKEHKFLLDWFLGQPQKARVSGYTNHRWNGVTTLHFSRLCGGIISKNLKLPHLQHAIPSGDITKCDMLREFAGSYHREDISITPVEAPKIIDRTLLTNNESLNLSIWAAAGYHQPPTVPEMIAEQAAFDYRLAGL